MASKKNYLNNLHQRLMKDPDYRKEYQKTQPFEELALKIVRYRCEAGLTQTQLARKIGTSQSTIARIESLEYGRMTMTTLNKIVEALNLELKIELLKKAS